MEDIGKNQGDVVFSYRGPIIPTLHVQYSLNVIPLNQGNEGEEEYEGNEEYV